MLIVTEPLTKAALRELTVAPGHSSIMELMEYELSHWEFTRFFFVYTKRRLRKAPQEEEPDWQPTKVLILNKLQKEFFEEKSDKELFDLFLEHVFFPAFDTPLIPSPLPEEQGGDAAREGDR